LKPFSKEYIGICERCSYIFYDNICPNLSPLNVST
jgi:hypothetical protein